MTPENKSQTTLEHYKFWVRKIKKYKSYTPNVQFHKTFFQINFATEAFNDYFLNVVEKLNIEDVNINSTLLSLDKLSSQDFPDMTVIPITEAEIICTVHLHP